jgi:uncharacterized membrane protein HdeD (DUF308 family)
MSTVAPLNALGPVRPMLYVLARDWRLVLARGIAHVLFGILAFSWPNLTLLTLVLVYGAYATLDGAFALVAALGDRRKSVPTWWLVLVGLAAIAAAITLLWSGITAPVPIFFVGAWAVVHAIFESVGAIQLSKEIDNERFLLLAGAMSLVFGLVMMIAPAAEAPTLIRLIGAYSILFGGLFVALALRLRNHQCR